MKLTLSVANGRAMLRRLAPAIRRPGRWPEGHDMLLVKAFNGAITAAANDGDGLQATTGVPGSATEDGCMFFETRTLKAVLRGAGKDGFVTIEHTGSNATVFETATATVRASHPAVESWEDKLRLPLNARKVSVDFAHLREVAEAASKDMAVPVVTGVHLKGTDVVATDRYVLSLIRSAKADYGEALTIPARFVRALPKLDGVHKLAVTSSHVWFQGEGTTLRASLIEGEFPNYRLYSDPDPDSTKVLLHMGEGFVSTLAEFGKLQRSLGMLPMAYIDGEGARLTVSANDEETRSQISFLLDARCDLPVRVWVNPQFAVKALAGAGTSTLEQGRKPVDPLRIQWADNDVQHVRVFMPIRPTGGSK